jgi:hypothetical protein
MSELALLLDQPWLGSCTLHLEPPAFHELCTLTLLARRCVWLALLFTLERTKPCWSKAVFGPPRETIRFRLPTACLCLFLCLQ